MGMATLQFYKNKYKYPEFGRTLATYGTELPCTPVGMGLKSGTVRVKGDMTDFMSCNYLRFTRDNQSFYAWVDDVNFHTEDSFTVSYSVDPWRTYQSKVNLGTQFIARRPGATNKKDDLLGATQTHPIITTKTVWKTPNTNNRVFVVQVRPTGATQSNTPVQPSPYSFYTINYNVNNWTDNAALAELMVKLREGAQPINIVTMYSIPYMDTSGLGQVSMPIDRGGDNVEYTTNTWRLIQQQEDNVHSLLTRHIPITIDENISELMRVDHAVQIVLPEAGIISIPDELLNLPDLQLREDIDLFSGASNYMVVSGTDKFYNLSARGSSVSSIPIISDPLDTYLSQNQNALTTSLIGDVASLVGGAAMTVGTGGLGAAVGGGAVASGVNGIVSRWAGIKDIGNSYSNPPAFLGTALAGAFNNRFWIVVTKQPVDNATLVHNNFGYPLGKVDNLTFPSSGFIQTEGCNVSSDGSVPRWALEEINGIFNNGVLVHPS